MLLCIALMNPPIPNHGSSAIPGTALQQAIEFAQNRYPNCKVEVPTTAAKKPKLARAKNGPRETARRRLKLVEKRNEPADR